MKRLLLLLFLPTLALAQWHTNTPYKSWDATNCNYFGGVAGTGYVQSVIGSTPVDTNSTSWSFITTNTPYSKLTFYQPLTNLWVAQWSKSNVWVKTAFPQLPSDSLYTNGWPSNTCILASVSNQCVGTDSLSNSVTNVCIITGAWNRQKHNHSDDKSAVVGNAEHGGFFLREGMSLR